MAFQTTSVTINAAVATNGTITFPYPSGYAAADFSATGARLALRGLQSILTQSGSTFSVAYGATIVVTYLDSTTIPAGSLCVFEGQLAGTLAADLTGTAAAVTDSTTGTPDTSAPIALAAVTNPTLSDWDGATVFPSAAQATAIGAAITALKNNQATQSDQYDALKADVAALRAAVLALI
jgi:hypothetical protein